MIEIIKHADKKSFFAFATMIIFLLCLLLFIGNGQYADSKPKPDMISVEREHIQIEGDSKFGYREKSKLYTGEIKGKKYYPSAPLKNQIDILQKDAEKGNAHATCVLSHTLLLCKERFEKSGLDKYSVERLLSMKKNEIENLESAIASYDATVDHICDGINEGDIEGIDEAIYQSAKLGDLKAMRLYVMQQYNRGVSQDSEIAKSPLGDRYRQDVEKMMNSAANGGDPEILEMVAIAYLAGRIEPGPIGVEVKPDPVKAFAALSALLSMDDYSYTRGRDPSYLAKTKRDLQRLIDTLDQVEKARFSEIHQNYMSAYQARHNPGNAAESLLNELPEQVCASTERRAVSAPARFPLAQSAHR